MGQAEYKGDALHRSADVAALREQLETRFPGKWLSQSNVHRTVMTGLKQIDQGLTHGLMRRRVSEWIGHESSGKTTILRSIIRNWCAAGLYVVYIDSGNKLVASDWAFVAGHNRDEVRPASLFDREKSPVGKFFIVRNLNEPDVLWATEQLVRSAIFDVVILDAGSFSGLNKAYARIQRALDRSKTAFVLLRNEPNSKITSSTTWGCDSRFKFAWSEEIQCQSGLTGLVSIQPVIQGTVWRDGLTQNLEVSGDNHVPNRLFTHPQVPDRRTPKRGAGAKKTSTGSNSQAHEHVLL